MDALGHLVVGMDLDAEVATGIDEFDEQGQLAMVFCVDGMAEDGLGGFTDDGDEVPPNSRLWARWKGRALCRVGVGCHPR